MGMCKECGNVVAATEIKSGYCKDCYQPEKVITQDNNTINVEVAEDNTLRQVLGFMGAFVLIVGVFAPLINVPIMGSVNYFQNGKGDGTFVLALGIISLVLILAKQYKWLWITGLGSLGLLTFTFFHFQSKISQMKTEMETGLAGNPFRGLVDVAMQSVQIQWGFALLAVGAILLIISAAKK